MSAYCVILFMESSEQTRLIYGDRCQSRGYLLVVLTRRGYSEPLTRSGWWLHGHIYL